MVIHEIYKAHIYKTKIPNILDIQEIVEQLIQIPLASTSPNTLHTKEFYYCKYLYIQVAVVVVVVAVVVVVIKVVIVVVVVMVASSSSSSSSSNSSSKRSRN